MTNSILVVDSVYVDEAIAKGYPFMEALASMAKYVSFVNRPEAEVNMKWRQPIVYAALYRSDDPPTPLYLTYMRQKGGEARLDAKFSVGFGGHIELSDAKSIPNISLTDELNAKTLADIFMHSFRREMQEELDIRIPSQLQLEDLNPKLYIVPREISTPVDNVHVGIFLKLNIDDIGLSIDSSEIRSADSTVKLMGWLHREAILSSNPENWTKAMMSMD